MVRQATVLMTLVWTLKEGRQQSSSRRGVRTFKDDDMMVMMMMMIFYRGIGTKSTATQNSNAKRRKNDTDEDDDGNNSNTKTNEDNKGKQQMKTRPKDYGHGHDKRQNRYVAALVAEPTRSDTTRMMNEGCATLMETSDDGHGDDLHQGRMEDDEDGSTPMLSATGTLDRKTGQATPIWQSATGTLDRKTNQAPPMTCFQPRTLTNETRPTTNSKECRGHDEDTKDGCRMTMMSTAASRGKLLDDDRQVDSMVLDYQGEAQSTFSALGPSGWRGSVSIRGCDL
jgi:hypothetical protein